MTRLYEPMDLALLVPFAAVWFVATAFVTCVAYLPPEPDPRMVRGHILSHVDRLPEKLDPSPFPEPPPPPQVIIPYVRDCYSRSAD